MTMLSTGASRLEALPLEILLGITGYLGTSDYSAMRLLSRTVERRLFKEWAREYFTERHFCNTKTSLEALKDISQRPFLSFYVKKLILTPIKLGNGAGASITKRAQKQAMAAFRKETTELQKSGDDWAMISEAMACLKNCETIEFRTGNTGPRSGKIRDIPDLRCYGTKELGVLTNERVWALMKDTELGFAKYLNRLFKALASSKMQPVKIVANTTFSGVSPSAFKFSSAGRITVRACLASLQYFSVVLYPMELRLELEKRAKKVGYLRDFLLCTENLRTLRLESLGRKFYIWDLFSPQKTLASVTLLPKLECLELNNWALEPQELLDFISGLANPSKIDIQRVLLEEESWPSWLGSVERAQRNHGALPRLETLVLSTVKQYNLETRLPVQLGTSIAPQGVSQNENQTMLYDIVVSRGHNGCLNVADVVPNICILRGHLRAARRSVTSHKRYLTDATPKPRREAEDDDDDGGHEQEEEIQAETDDEGDGDGCFEPGDLYASSSGSYSDEPSSDEETPSSNNREVERTDAGAD